MVTSEAVENLSMLENEVEPDKEAFVHCAKPVEAFAAKWPEHPNSRAIEAHSSSNAPLEISEVACINTPVQQEGHQEGDGDIHDNLKNDEEDGQEGGNQVPLCLFFQILYHRLVSN